MKETDAARIMADQNVSCPDAVRRVAERSEEVMVVGVKTLDDVPRQHTDPDMLYVKKVDFVAFITLFINCTAQRRK